MIDPDTLRRGTAAAGLVTQMVLATILCGGLGTWLDGRWQTGRALGLLGLLAGFALGMTSLLRNLLANPDPPAPDPPQRTR